MKAAKKDLKTSRNIIVVGFALIAFCIYPIVLINDFPKESNLIKINDVLIAKNIKNQRRGAMQLELTLKTYPEKLQVSDLAYRRACENCLDLNIGDSIFVGILKENIIRNKIYSIRNKQKEILILEDYRLASHHNNKRIILLFSVAGLITIGLGIWMRAKILASR